MFKKKQVKSLTTTNKYRLFGEILNANMESSGFVKFIARQVLLKNKILMTYLNATGLVQYFQDNDFLKLVGSFQVIYPDGWGAVFFLRILGVKTKERINAADFIDEIFDKLNLIKTKIYLLGDTNKVIHLAAKKISSKYKNIKVVGSQNGFFEENESIKIVTDIKKRKPNLVLIGMGQPKQEYFVYDNYEKLPKAVYWCVGGLFGYIAGTKKRAPNLMLNLKLEWLYRFFQEPRRLFYRYTIGNLRFIFLIAKFYLSEKTNFLRVRN